MKVWFDTEFYENGVTIELISIGMVNENGVPLYFETLNAHQICSKDHWLIENVFPHLRGGAFVKSRNEIASTIIAFAGDNPEFWAYYADYDWVVLCQLYGRMIDLPKGWPMFCMDLKQLAVMKGDPKLPDQEDAEHNALNDARWCKGAHEFLERHTRGYYGR